MAAQKARFEPGIIMPAFAVTDWDDAYANMPNVVGGEGYADKWSKAAAGFRDAPPSGVGMKLDLPYADADRCTYDLFEPVGAARGLLVFIHGGYWMRFDKSFFSHFAAGGLARGWAVAMPQYPLCPQVRIRDITLRVGEAINTAAGTSDGPIALAGHSAGGHLAMRMICADNGLSRTVRSRIRAAVSISGVHDLRPLMGAALNQTLRLDEAEAIAESPALLRPAATCPVTCWVGANERSEFVRQNALLANIWRGLGATTEAIMEPDRNHFSVVEALCAPDHPLTRMLTPG
jgi:acetyl esterase/lipase